MAFLFVFASDSDSSSFESPLECYSAERTMPSELFLCIAEHCELKDIRQIASVDHSVRYFLIQLVELSERCILEAMFVKVGEEIFFMCDRKPDRIALRTCIERVGSRSNWIPRRIFSLSAVKVYNLKSLVHFIKTCPNSKLEIHLTLVNAQGSEEDWIEIKNNSPLLSDQITLLDISDLSSRDLVGVYFPLYLLFENGNRLSNVFISDAQDRKLISLEICHVCLGTPYEEFDWTNLRLFLV